MFMFDDKNRKIISVNIEKELNDVYLIQGFSGLYSKDLIFDNKFDLYVSLLKERMNFNISHFSNDKKENNQKLHEMFGYLFGLDSIMENFEKLNDDFFHQLRCGSDLKSFDHLYLEKYFILYYTTMWEMRNHILKDKSENYDYTLLNKLNVNLNYANMFLDPSLSKCYGPIINYSEIFKLTNINIPLYYAKYDYFINALDIQHMNPSPFGIDYSLYQKQFSHTMQDNTLISNLSIDLER